MIDLGLVAAAKKAVAAKPRKHVTPAMLLAVCDQESHCMPYFVDTKPGSQYALNMGEAIVHKVRDKHGNVLERIPTSLKESEIRGYITLPEEVDGWKVPKELAGQRAKWRFEYGWWKHYGKMTNREERFMLSSSWGLVQFMGFNIIGNSGKTGGDAIAFIRKFACDVPLQLLYAAGMFDDLLTDADGDLLRAYKGYNSGKIDSQDPAVIARAKAVVANAARIKLQIKE